MDGIVMDRAQTLFFFRLTQAPQFEIISIIIKTHFGLEFKVLQVSNQ